MLQEPACHPETTSYAPTNSIPQRTPNCVNLSLKFAILHENHHESRTIMSAVPGSPSSFGKRRESDSIAHVQRF